MLIVYFDDGGKTRRFAVHTDEEQNAFDQVCAELDLTASEWTWDEPTNTYRAGPTVISFAYVDKITEI